MGIPARHDLAIYQGDDYTLRLTLEDTAGVPLVLTGRTYAAQIRTAEDAAVATVAFTVDLTNLATGLVVLSLTDAQTRLLVSGVWDLEETLAVVSSTLLRGAVTVMPDVTR